MKRVAGILIGLLLVIQCDGIDQDTLNYIGNNLEVNYEVINNLNGNNENFSASITLRNKGSANVDKDLWELYFYCLYMIEPSHLPDPNGYEVPHAGVKISHINGGLFKLEPTASFKTLEARVGSLTIFLIIQYWSVSRTDTMPLWYVASTGLIPVDILSTKDLNSQFVSTFSSPNQYKRYKEDLHKPYTPEERYNRYADTNANAKPKYILPTPVLMSVDESQTISLTSLDWKIECRDYLNECNYLADLFDLGMDVGPSDHRIVITSGSVDGLDDSLYLNESYSLVITNNVITITSPSAAGAFYGIQSFLSLYDMNRDAIPHVNISDAPRYEYRGMFLDVSRNFVPKDVVINLLKVMATYKLNKFHFHLSDDEGWRIYMDWCPELTEVGGRRSHDLNETSSLFPMLGSGSTDLTSGSGYYTKSDYQQILKTAEEHHIHVIPEIDLPGHAHAAVKANLAYYNRLLLNGSSQNDAESVLISDLEDKSQYLSVQYFTDNAVNPCMEGTYTFVRNVVQGLAKLHSGIQNLTHFHLGGDEVGEAWTDSPKCQQFMSQQKNVNDLMEYFITNASQTAVSASELPLTLGLWEDGALSENDVPYNKMDLSNNDVIAYVWQNIWEWGVANRAYKLANADYKVVMSQATHLYFDQPNEPDPEERGLYWASRFTDTRKTFSFMPDDVYSNADYTRSGAVFTEDDLCVTEEACPPLNKPGNIIGMQGQLWCETVRTTPQLHYMIFPRLLALAERSWHKAAWESSSSNDFNQQGFNDDWAQFAATLGHKELHRLDRRGIQYRIPLPGIKVVNGQVMIGCEFPGLSTRYRENQGEWHSAICGSSFTVDAASTVEYQMISAQSGSAGLRYSRSVIIASNSAPSYFNLTSTPFIVFLVLLIQFIFM